jgi:hypothetical protein
VANESTLTAVNLVGVLRAPRGDGLESMLIAVEVSLWLPSSNQR